MAPINRLAIGRNAEVAVARWYERRGYCVLAHSWRCRTGEIDLVVARDRHIAFVEVKCRSTSRFGTAFEAVDTRKQAQVRRVAAVWLSEWEGPPIRSIRFDAASVQGGKVEVICGAW